jgi:hypothetical protein
MIVWTMSVAMGDKSTAMLATLNKTIAAIVVVTLIELARP